MPQDVPGAAGRRQRADNSVRQHKTEEEQGAENVSRRRSGGGSDNGLWPKMESNKECVQKKRSLQEETRTHLMSMPTCQNACTVESNWLPTRTKASLTCASSADPFAHSVITSWSCFVRLSRRDTARCTSDSEREECGDGRELVDEDGEMGDGEGGIEEVEDTVQVESAEAGRREVCGKVGGCNIQRMRCELTLTLMWERLGSLRGHETGVMGCPRTKLLGWMWTCMATSVEDGMDREVGGR